MAREPQLLPGVPRQRRLNEPGRGPVGVIRPKPPSKPPPKRRP